MSNWRDLEGWPLIKARFRGCLWFLLLGLCWAVLTCIALGVLYTVAMFIIGGLP